MRAIRALAAATALLTFPLPAAAQNPGAEGYRKLSEQQAIEELDIYSGCVVARRETGARALALAPFGSAEQGQAAKQIMRSADEDCIQGGFDHVKISVRSDVLAGAVARRLLARDYPDLPAVIDRKLVDAEAERARTSQLSVAERFGSCVVWNDPAGVQALLRSNPGSAEERAAIAGLQHDMGMCLEEGSTLRLDRAFVRNVSAVSAYKLAHHLRPTGARSERG